MRFIAGLFIVCSLLMSGPDAVAMWTLGVLIYGFSTGPDSRRNGGDRF